MQGISRRRFLRTTFAGAAGLSVLPLMKSCRTPANDVIRLGIIGLGRQAMYLMRGFSEIKGVQVVAGADVYGIKRERFERRMKDLYPEAGKEIRCDDV
jgi:ornithine cyclodeaminase/alanine dehydrogenase-like protein (mu-crystallin family)